MVVHIQKTELARRTRYVVDLARRGQPVFVASYGEEQVAIVDAVDYRLLRAVADYARRMETTAGDGGDKRASAGEPFPTADEEVDDDLQRTWNEAIAAYLRNDISLGRVAELLGMPRWDVQQRFHRLRLPLQLGPATAADARAEVAAARAIGHAAN